MPDSSGRAYIRRMPKEFDPTDIDAQQVAQAQQLEAGRLRRDQECEDFKWLMQDRRGRRVVWRLLDKAGVFRTSFNVPNAMQVSFNEGQRNLGLLLLAEIQELCPDKFHLMTKEAKDDAKRYAKHAR